MSTGLAGPLRAAPWRDLRRGPISGPASGSARSADRKAATSSSVGTRCFCRWSRWRTTCAGMDSRVAETGLDGTCKAVLSTARSNPRRSKAFARAAPLAPWASVKECMKLRIVATSTSLGRAVVSSGACARTSAGV